jgi:replicative DNA helicase
MIERNIIGLVLIGQLDPSTTGLEEKHFTNFSHKQIWESITDLTMRKMTPDLITVAEALPKSDDWFTILGIMAKETIGSFSAKDHVKKIKENWRVKAIKDIGAEMQNSADTNVNTFIKSLMALDSTEKKYLHSFEEAAAAAVDEIEKVMDGDSLTVPTGLFDVDKVMGGLHNSDLIIVAARPAMGKTAFMLNIAEANKNAPLIFSTEMSRVQAAQRLFSIVGNVPNHKIRTGDINDEDFARIGSAIESINNHGGWIYDKSGPFMSEIESVARQVKHDHGCTAIYLDYLQRIKHENPKLPKHEQVGDIAMRLKELARELNIPVVALAQVSRKVEERTDKRPEMGDIKDSGTIEQEADIILTLYRDNVYNKDSPDGNICEVNFKKNRHGGTGLVNVQWTAPTMVFDNLTNMIY